MKPQVARPRQSPPTNKRKGSETMRIRSAKICDAHRSVRPRESGDPGAKHSNVSKSGPPLPRGRAEIVAPSVVTIPLSKSAVRLSELQIGKRKSAPVCMLRARGSPSFRLSHLPRVEGGWRADKAQCPDCSRRMSGSGRTMVHSGAPAPCGAPTGIFGLRLVNGRTSRSSLSLVVLSERRPWVDFA